MTDTLHVACPHCNTLNRVARARLGEGAACGKCKQRLIPDRPIELNRANFDRQVGATELPLVVDFWAEWCGPCKMMAPAFAEAAARMSPKVRLAKLDTEAEPEIAARFRIQAIPTLIVFKDGREVARKSGALGTAQLVQWISTSVAL